VQFNADKPGFEVAYEHDPFLAAESIMKQRIEVGSYFVVLLYP
jgi:hypothetical protein